MNSILFYFLTVISLKFGSCQLVIDPTIIKLDDKIGSTSFGVKLASQPHNQVLVYFETGDQVKLDRCMLVFYPQNFNVEQNVTMTSVPGYGQYQKDFNMYALTVSPGEPTAPTLANPTSPTGLTTSPPGYYNNIKTPISVQRTAIPALQCSVTGDPHFSSFRGKAFDFQGIGIYNMLMTNDNNVIVQVKTIACGGASCIDTFVFKYGNYIMKVALDRTNNKVDMSANVVDPTTLGVKVTKNDQANTVTIELPDGSNIRTSLNFGFGGYQDLVLRMAGNYYKHVNGLCGIMDDSADPNDMIGLDGTNHFNIADAGKLQEWAKTFTVAEKDMLSVTAPMDQTAQPMNGQTTTQQTLAQPMNGQTTTQQTTAQTNGFLNPQPQGQAGTQQTAQPNMMANGQPTTQPNGFLNPQQQGQTLQQTTQPNMMTTGQPMAQPLNAPIGMANGQTNLQPAIQPNTMPNNQPPAMNNGFVGPAQNALKKRQFQATTQLGGQQPGTAPQAAGQNQMGGQVTGIQQIPVQQMNGNNPLNNGGAGVGLGGQTQMLPQTTAQLPGMAGTTQNGLGTQQQPFGVGQQQQAMPQGLGGQPTIAQNPANMPGAGFATQTTFGIGMPPQGPQILTGLSNSCKLPSLNQLQQPNNLPSGIVPINPIDSTIVNRLPLMNPGPAMNYVPPKMNVPQGPQGWSSPEFQKAATAACESVLKDSHCNQMVDPATYLKNCLSDAQLTNSLGFVESIKTGYQMGCTSMIKTQVTTQSMVLSPSSYRLFQCGVTGKCNGRGVCGQTGCRCFQGYTGLDCSIAINMAETQPHVVIQQSVQTIQRYATLPQSKILVPPSMPAVEGMRQRPITQVFLQYTQPAPQDTIVIEEPQTTDSTPTPAPAEVDSNSSTVQPTTPAPASPIKKCSCPAKIDFANLPWNVLPPPPPKPY